jgi:hypothetical protein
MSDRPTELAQAMARIVWIVRVRCPGRGWERLYGQFRMEQDAREVVVEFWQLMLLEYSGDLTVEVVRTIASGGVQALR